MLISTLFNFAVETLRKFMGRNLERQLKEADGEWGMKAFADSAQALR